jgi:hypothetical protein
MIRNPKPSRSADWRIRDRHEKRGNNRAGKCLNNSRSVRGRIPGQMKNRKRETQICYDIYDLHRLKCLN